MTDTVGVEAMLATGATYRQIDYWTRTGRLRASFPGGRRGGSGYSREWPVAERDVCASMVRLLRLGIVLPVASKTARAAVEGGLDEVELAPHVTVYWPRAPHPTEGEAAIQ